MKLKNMRIFLVLLALGTWINATSQGTITYYVDPVKGNDTYSGTIDNPLKTLSKGLSLLGTKVGTIYLRGGTYTSASKIKLSNAGSPGNYICIWAYQNEKVRFDFTGNTSDGFSISGSYYYLKGIEASLAGHNGINISGSNNRIENCIVSYNKNTGLHITAGSGAPPPGPSGNQIVNCDSYFNFDPPVGGNADGFSAKWTVGPGNVFRGCRSYNNSDDGWDLWMCTGTIVIDSCVAFRNGVDTWYTGQVDGNGNGFKLGGNSINTPHIVRSCVSFDNAGNGGRGYDENNNYAGQTLYNCIGFRNQRSNFYLNNNPLVIGQHDVRNCISYLPGLADAIRNANMEHNSWQGYSVSADDFISLDTTGVAAPRDSAGHFIASLFLHLAAGSDLIDTGVYVGIPFAGKAPDLGPFESEAVMLHLPSIPLALFASEIRYDGFTINWTASEAATGYFIQIATDTEFINPVTGWEKKDVSDLTTFKITGLNSLTPYYYRIIAYNNDGESGASNVIRTVTLISPPLAPMSTDATLVTDSGFTANWNASATATGYKIDVATDSSFTGMLAGYNALDVKNVLKLGLTGLTANSDYYYRLYAYNAGGTGEVGNFIHVHTEPATGIVSAMNPSLQVIAESHGIRVIADESFHAIEVIDLQGRRIFSVNDRKQDCLIPSDNWDKGIYLVVVHLGSRTIVKKVLIH